MFRTFLCGIVVHREEVQDPLSSKIAVQLPIMAGYPNINVIRAELAKPFLRCPVDIGISDNEVVSSGRDDVPIPKAKKKFTPASTACWIVLLPGQWFAERPSRHAGMPVCRRTDCVK